MRQILISLLVLTFVVNSFSRTPEEWRSRTIYQLVTDRFARTNGDTSPCTNLTTYCGGTFQGIINNLDYITGMGFDAIWISPVYANIPDSYAGYLSQNLYEINPHFGSADDLKALIDACHSRDVWVLADVDATVMGTLTKEHYYSDKIPFNESYYYRTNDDMPEYAFLDHANIVVNQTLLSWVSDLVSNYGFDGVRVNSATYAPKNFWKQFTEATGTYTIGEVFDSYLPHTAGFQGSLSGVFNYPFFFVLRYVFQQYNSMFSLQDYFNNTSIWPDQSLIGTFVDNHDNSRFLFYNDDLTAFKSALAFSLTTTGIPIVYYGSEQGFNGGEDPANHEALWTSMNTSSEIYSFLKTIISFRKQAMIYQYDQIEKYVDDNTYVFTRGDYLFAFVNTKNNETIVVPVSFADGTMLCNVLDQTDCITVSNAELKLVMENGEVKIYAPQSQEKRSFLDIEGKKNYQFEEDKKIQEELELIQQLYQYLVDGN